MIRVFDSCVQFDVGKRLFIHPSTRYGPGIYRIPEKGPEV